MLTMYLYAKYCWKGYLMIKYILAAIALASLTACSTIQKYTPNSVGKITVGEQNPVLAAYNYYGMHESTDRTQLKEFLDVDPKRTEWCAAFINSVLEESGIKSNKDHRYPLTARAYLDWGTEVSKEDVQPGDIVVFPRGNQGWQGHVGFFVKRHIVGDTEYWLILGGNQSDKVSIAPYRASRSLGIRRPESI